MIAYDYSGYGRSGGKPSEKEIYCDIEEVGFFVKNILNIPTKDIVLLGQSLGSAPSVHLAINKNFKDLRAMILISPIASGVKLVSPDMDVKDLEKIDVFCNIRKINDVACPIFLIHGRLDEVIPIEQSIEMAQYMRNAYEWHPRHGDHSNIFTKCRSKFFQKCKFFFEYLNYHTKRNPNGNSISTFNMGEKVCQFEGIHHYIEESYLCNSEKKPNGIPFSKKDTAFTFKAEDQNLVLTNRIVTESESKISLGNGRETTVINFGQDIPFDWCSEGSGGKSLLQDNFSSRESKEEANFYCKEQRDLEEQYNIMLKKHNGI